CLHLDLAAAHRFGIRPAGELGLGDPGQGRRRTRTPARAAAPPEAGRSQCTRGATMTPVRALVVDDNPINIELAAFVLRAQGFVVESAGGATEAMERARSFCPDVILMDIQMPDVD